MKPTRLFVSLCVLIVVIGLASLILFRPSKQQFSPSSVGNAAETNQPTRAYRPIPTNNENDNAMGGSATVDETKGVSGPDQKQNTLSTTTRITDEGATQTTTVTYENGITTTTTVTKYPDGLIDTHKEWEPDHPGIRSPQDLSIEEEVELASQWLALYDDDPNVTGVVKGQNGKFYPLYDNTVYVTRSERTTEEGNVVYTGYGAKGDIDFDSLTEIPAGKRVIELDKEGNTLADYISNGDPWQYILARGLDPIVYFYGEETAAFMEEYFNATTAVASQALPAEGGGQDTAFVPSVDPPASHASILTDSETPRLPPSQALLDRVRERGFEPFDDVVKRLHDVDPEKAWKKRYLPNILTPKEPDDIMRRNSDVIDMPDNNEASSK